MLEEEGKCGETANGSSSGGVEKSLKSIVGKTRHHLVLVLVQYALVHLVHVLKTIELYTLNG